MVTVKNIKRPSLTGIATSRFFHIARAGKERFAIIIIDKSANLD